MTQIAASVINLRDIGGIRLTGGGVTRSGVLLRSGAPRAGDLPAPGLLWPPATVLDLRSAEEHAANAYDWMPSTRVFSFDVHDEAAMQRAAALNQAPDWTALYGEILNGLARDIAPIMEVVVDSPGSVLVHCAAGKDRTGVLVGALLTAAGADPEAVTEDYLASNVAMRVLAARWAEQAGIDVDDVLASPWLTVSADALHSALDQITADGVDAWFLDNGVPQDHLDAWTARIRA